MKKDNTVHNENDPAVKKFIEDWNDHGLEKALDECDPHQIKDPRVQQLLLSVKHVIPSLRKLKREINSLNGVDMASIDN
jgi:hypothetical protein